MLEPQLAHHRAEFERLGRHQRVTVALMPLAGGLGYFLLRSLSVPGWAYYSLMAIVVLGIGAIGFYEVRRTIVFYRDLRERRTLDEGADAD